LKTSKQKRRTSCAKNLAANERKRTIPKSRRLEIGATNEAEADRKIADGALLHIPAAITAVDFGKGYAGELSLMAILEALRVQCVAINDGSLKDAEALLISQALALNTIFGELARRAALNMGEHLAATDTYLRLALKAQSQSRATLETLAAIKNPPVVFAKQANIAHGHQQVNNATSRAGNLEMSQNELLKV
jgi:urease beta subunit